MISGFGNELLEEKHYSVKRYFVHLDTDVCAFVFASSALEPFPGRNLKGIEQARAF